MKEDSKDKRLERAKDVSVQVGDNNSWNCKSKDSENSWIVKWVNFSYVCNCPAQEFKNEFCKHIIAVMNTRKKDIPDVDNIESMKIGSMADYKNLEYDRDKVIASFKTELMRGDQKSSIYWLQVMIACKESAYFISNYISAAVIEEICVCDPMTVIGIKTYLNPKINNEKFLYHAVRKICQSMKWWECEICSSIRLLTIANKKEINSHNRRGVSDYIKSDKWSSSFVGMFWRRECFKQEKDLIKTKWQDVEYKDQDKYKKLDRIKGKGNGKN